jgi:LacI family transcriptional regulator
MHGAEDCAHDLGYGILLCNTGENPELEAGYISSLSNEIVEGFLIAPTDGGALHVAELRENSIPVVCVSRGLKNETVSMVGIDNKKVGYEATKYLIEQGHRTIAMLNGMGAYVYELRLEGYRKALEEALIPFRKDLVYYINSVDINECASWAEKIFTQKPMPDAIFSGSDPKAIGTIHAFKKMGYSIPRDISIISVDDLHFSEFIDPPLTTVRQPFYDMGTVAAKMLIKMIEGKKKENQLTVKFLPTTLMIRGSTKGDSKNAVSFAAGQID